MHEFDLIARYFAPLAHPDFALGLKDDAALLNVPEGKQLIITTDTLNQGIHFTGNEPAELIARKALRTNLSDLAAMGAEPYGYTLNIAAPKDTEETLFAGFAKGLAEDQAQYTIQLLGGDTTATNAPLSLTITAYGLVEKGAALTRSGAQLGDAIYVTGIIGEAALGLNVAQGKLPANDAWLDAYRLPEPRIALATDLVRIATSCMDISDGLAQDLTHLCAVSQLGATIEVATIPVVDATQRALCITGGDDYELLFTAPEGAMLPQSDVPITRIGVMTKQGVDYYLEGKPFTLTQMGYQHF